MQDFSIQPHHLDEVLKQHRLSHEDYVAIQKLIGREPNLIEIGIFSAMWSEHCSYKSSKIYLKGFPTQAPWVLQGPGENAGVIDIGDNLAIVFKIESHNHPSFIEPNAGAATGVGGILRDIFTMGADPIANLNAIRFGNIHDKDTKKRHVYLLHGVVEGIGHYGNCVGVPTIGGETSFESCYNGNILVNAFSLGIARKNAIFYGRASGDGNLIMYVGSKTGRDGLGGAVMSSDSFNATNQSLRPTVQIGDPFVEKLLLDACLEIFKENLIIGIQDMGAAGLTSSSFEMANRSGSGMILWLDKIPMREEGMNPYEIMLSESQERMLLCVKKGCENRIKEIFNKYELSAEVVGEVRNNGRIELFWNGEKCVDLEVTSVVENAPILNRPVKIPSYLKTCETLCLSVKNLVMQQNLAQTEAMQGDRIPESLTDSIIDQSLLYKTTYSLLLREMLCSLEVCDKAWIYNQYDSSIKASTIKGAGLGGASIISLQHYDSKKALAMSAKCNVRYCYLNPKIGAKIAVVKAGRKVALSGAKPLAITDCLNFGSPENPEVMFQFKESCEGIKEACEILNTPVVSGNVSLYNQTNENAIYPTPSIVSVGVLEDSNQAIGTHFVQYDSILCRIGATFCANNFAGSLLQKIIHSPISGRVHDIDLHLELRLWGFLQESIKANKILSARDIGQGGIAVTLSKMAIIGNIGVRALQESVIREIADSLKNSTVLSNLLSSQIQRFSPHYDMSVDNKASLQQMSYQDSMQNIQSFGLSLFSEEQSQVICEVSRDCLESLYMMAKEKNLDFEIIGKVGGERIALAMLDIPLDEARSLYYESFERHITI